MLLNVTMVIVLAGLPVDIHAGESALTTMRVEERPGSATVEWRDAEDVIRGTLTPFPIRVGVPFTVSLVVGTVQGEDFTGPVTMALRPLEDLGGTDAVTVARSEGEKAWVHTFTPDDEGQHRLEVSFRTTHLKVVRGVVPVAPAKLPKWLLSALGGGLIAVAVTVGAWLTLRRREGQAS
jgi:hypothetical protein